MFSRSEQLARWASRLRFEDLPADVIESTKLRILDVMGLALAGLGTAFGQSVRQGAIGIGSSGEGRIFGTGDRLGATTAAFVNAGLELLDQLNGRGIRADAVVHASTSGGTQAGLYTAMKVTQSGIQVLGISAGPPREVVTSRVRGLTGDLITLLGLDWRPHPDDIVVTDEYVGERYGVPTPACLDAMRLVARTEGTLLDPVYTGKAMAGLIDLVRRGQFAADQTVIFWHTGGQPAIFAYAGWLTEG